MPNATPTPATPPSVGARLAAESREGAVRDRFLRDVLTHVPLDRIAELHLFAPMRQGGVESGVAVVAARPDVPPIEPDAESVVEAAPEPAAGPAEPPRHTVYTARYRHTVRGPDRGRWQVDVREEADAPLVTVDVVVRGVQRRAGDASAPARLDAAAVARLVGALA